MKLTLWSIWFRLTIEFVAKPQHSSYPHPQRLKHSPEYRLTLYCGVIPWSTFLQWQLGQYHIWLKPEVDLTIPLLNWLNLHHCRDGNLYINLMEAIDHLRHRAAAEFTHSFPKPHWLTVLVARVLAFGLVVILAGGINISLNKFYMTLLSRPYYLFPEITAMYLWYQMAFGLGSLVALYVIWRIISPFLTRDEG